MEKDLDKTKVFTPVKDFSRTMQFDAIKESTKDWISKVNFQDPNDVKRSVRAMQGTVVELLNGTYSFNEEDFFAFGLMLQNLLAKDRGVNIEFDGFADHKTKEIGHLQPKYSLQPWEVGRFSFLFDRNDSVRNIIKANYNHDAFLSLKQPNSSRRQRMRALATMVSTIEHEIRHEEQIKIARGKKTFSPTTLVLNKELKNILISELLTDRHTRKFYEYNHDDFLIEKDAEFAALVRTPISLKKYFPFLSNEDCKILDINDNKKKNLMQSIKEHKNTTWDILRKRLYGRGLDTTKEFFDGSRQVDIEENNSMATIYSQSDSLEKVLDKQELNKMFKELPILKFIYADNGKLKGFPELFSDYKEMKEKISSEEIEITGNKEMDFERCLDAYTAIFATSPRLSLDFTIMFLLESYAEANKKQCAVNMQYCLNELKKQDADNKKKGKKPHFVEDCRSDLKSVAKLPFYVFTDTDLINNIADQLPSGNLPEIIKIITNENEKKIGQAYADRHI